LRNGPLQIGRLKPDYIALTALLAAFVALSAAFVAASIALSAAFEALSAALAAALAAFSAGVPEQAARPRDAARTSERAIDLDMGKPLSKKKPVQAILGEQLETP
jgi:hypothetical protein